MTTGWLYRLDPRTKLLLQLAVVGVAYLKTEPLPLVILSGLIGGSLLMNQISIRHLVFELRYLIGFLSIAPIIGAVHLGTPWFELSGAIPPGLAAYRVFLLVVVGLVIVRTTRDRELQAAIRWFIPGRLGQVIALGVVLVLQFLPVIRSEIDRTMTAVSLRGGAARPVSERIRLIGIVVLVRLFDRTDRVSQALKSRCLSWNPTPVELRFSRIDIIGGGLILWLLGWGLW